MKLDLRLRLTALAPHRSPLTHLAEHYTADAMQLCVLGTQPLDDLEACIVNQFAELRRGVAPMPTLPVNPSPARPLRGPLAPTQKGAVLRATPVRETRVLRLHWELGPEPAFATSKSLRLLASILSDESEGSLSWLLTRHMQPPLATTLSCGSQVG